MKYRPSKSFILAILGMCPLFIGAGYVLNRDRLARLSSSESSLTEKKNQGREIESSNLRASKTKRATRDINAQRREKWLDFAEHFNKTSTAAVWNFPRNSAITWPIEADLRRPRRIHYGSLLGDRDSRIWANRCEK
jgi:hypothetical protein